MRRSILVKIQITNEYKYDDKIERKKQEDFH